MLLPVGALLITTTTAQECDATQAQSIFHS